MKGFLFLITFFISTLVANAQHEFDNWFFGDSNAISLVSGSPVAVTGGVLYTIEGCASISTPTGTLLFYTDGSTVYNSNNQIMPNGSGLYGSYSSSQGALIVSDPSNSNLYYIFTVSNLGLYYSIVDMTLQTGLGDITSKNIQLLSSSQEKLTGVKQSSGNGYWIIAHDLINNSTSYYAYPLTSFGVGVPVISNVGAQNTSLSPYIGCMKASPDGTKLASALCNFRKVEILDFDAATGIVSNPFLFNAPLNELLYGVEFSGTGNTLYISAIKTVASPLSRLYQLNMAAGTQAAILASATDVYSTTNRIGTLYLASNNKIYAANIDNNYLGVINNPDLLGVACNYDSACIYLPKAIYFGLQNSICGDII